MLNLLILRKHLDHLEPREVLPQQLPHLRHIRFHHLPETRYPRVLGDGVLPDHAGYGGCAGKVGEADIDELEGVQITVEVPKRGFISEMSSPPSEQLRAERVDLFWASRIDNPNSPRGAKRSGENDTGGVDRLPNVRQVALPCDLLDEHRRESL